MNDDTGGDGDGTDRVGRRAILRRGVGALAATALAPARSVGLAVPGRQRPRLVFALRDTDAAVVRPLVDEYARRYGVTIEIEPNPLDGLLETLTINLTQGTGAYDVVSVYDPWLPALAGDDLLVDLGEILDARGLVPDPDFVPGLLALGEFPTGSGLRALPWIGNVQLFARRQDLLADLGLSAPATWDDVLTNARAIGAAGGASGRFGFGLRGQSGAPAAVSFLPVLRGHGAELFDAAWEPQLETPAAMRAMEIHLALAALAPPGVDRVGHEENGRNLVDGVVAQSADVWPDLLLTIGDPVAAAGGAIEIGGEPAQPGVRPATMTGSWLLGIPEGSGQAEAALDFVLWLTAPTQQKRLLLDGATPATRSSVLRDPEAVARFPFLPVLHGAARGAVPRPRSPYYARVEAIVGGAVAQALAGRLSGEAALRGANAEIRAYMVREGVIEE